MLIVLSFIHSFSEYRYTAFSNLFKLLINVSDGLNIALKSAVVNIHVLGEDPVPVFSERVYYTNVKENSEIGSTIIQLPLFYNGVLVTFTEKLTLTFSIRNLKDVGDNLVEIDSEGKVSVASHIDHEKVQTIFMLATACVTTAGMDKCGFSHVTINVTDENDNRPVFERSSYQVFLTDTQSNETFVVGVQATDADSPGPNSRISYHIVDDPYLLFRMNNATGELFTTRPLGEKKLFFMFTWSHAGSLLSPSTLVVT